MSYQLINMTNWVIEIMQDIASERNKLQREGFYISGITKRELELRLDFR